MNIERDQFLTEALGACWHDVHRDSWENDYGDLVIEYRCVKCKALSPMQNDFSTWNSFGWLFEKCQSKDWWDAWVDATVRTCFTRAEALNKYISPDRFANSIWEFLREKKL